MKLKKLLSHLDFQEIKGNDGLEIKDIFYDSRDVKTNSAFFALVGEHSDGHKFIDQAINKGAKCIFYSDLIEYRDDITYIKIKDSKRVLSKASKILYFSDQLNIGVTGTDGKSSICYFLYQLLNNVNLKAGLLSTVFLDYDKIKKNDLRQSTPESRDIYYFKHLMQKNDKNIALIEATSHGLDHQTKRLLDCDFNIAVFSNITFEHIDFHKTVDNYRNAKANLIRQLKDKNGKKAIAILNKDDVSYDFLKKVAKEYNIKILTYSALKEADLYANNIKESLDSLEFDLIIANKKHSIKLKNIIGAFNVYNLMACLLVLKHLNKLDEALNILNSLKPLSGRMELINYKECNLIIDYAHTPESFKNVMPFFKKNTLNRLIVVFGSAGSRDKDKREIQGQIASSYADIIILTDEDPREEGSIAVIYDIEKGIKKDLELYKIPNRKEAIEKAISLLKKGDTAVFLGKGHEESIIYYENNKLVKHPWNEKEAILNILKREGNGK